ncbi:MAG: hypothetical protein LPK85_13120, partial [Gammaproteobacteria bacterium]|nr:hypothetical protein [Gammaproteobacteria bacterium]
ARWPGQTRRADACRAESVTGCSDMGGQDKPEQALRYRAANTSIDIPPDVIAPQPKYGYADPVMNQEAAFTRT